MKKHNLALLFAVVLLTVSGAFAKPNLKDDMKLFASWFEGRFDNFAQFYDDKDSKTEFPHDNIHSIFTKVELPAIGENVFYVQQYADGDEAKVYRQRLYNFTVNKQEKALQLTIYNFDDEKKYRDSHIDKSKLNALSMTNLTTVQGCEVYWKISETRDKFITDDLVLTKDEIWINDQATDEQGSYVFGNKAGIHSKLKRVRWFEGYTAILKTGETPMTNKDFTADEYDGKTKVPLHDQGGTVKLNDKYSAQLAQLRYKSGIWVMTLSIIENASGRKVAYTWANPEAEKIGINLRWVQAGFTLKK
jgi:hypothetical protein